jgi:iron(III) transport system substrate-binding protein
MRRAVLFIAAAVLVLGWLLRAGGKPGLVVYCAHDSIYADAILRDFTKQTGIAVAARYDTEATKSLGLIELLVREKNAPRCDVFWNNELAGTLDLQEKGLLVPYRGPGWQRIPAGYKDAVGNWSGFAARMRVQIYNTQKIAPPANQAPEPVRDLSRFAIARPLYGTTLTHYAFLWQRWGRDKTISWHRDWRARGVRELNGNAAVKDAVAEGVCDAGFTDTDDFFEAKDAGKPVAMQPVQLEDGATICIPNTVAIIRGTRRENDARRLVDFLLSAETELALARSKSRQIPLGPVPVDQVPAEVRELQAAAQRGAPLTNLLPARNECLAWLKSEELK